MIIQWECKYTQGIRSEDRVPEEIWMEVCDIVQEAVIKAIPSPQKKMQKGRWPSGEALHTAKKRGEAKGKGEKERYTHLNAEFQRIARRDEKAFLSDQCKEREENNRMGRLEISSRKFEEVGNISCKGRHNKGQKWYGPNRSRRY